MLTPNLAPGDIVIMDNLGSHKVKGVREAIERRGATLLYLPAYCPELNAIEQVIAALKALFRPVAARTVDALWSAIAQVLQALSPAECANYFAHAGYGLPVRNPL